MRIVLARHGETTANAERRFQGILDCPLNEVGRRQAEELACVIARYKPGKIFTSDLIRSIETAKPAARLLQISPVADPVFREYSWGILEGLTLQEAQDRYPEIFHVSLRTCAGWKYRCRSSLRIFGPVLKRTVPASVS